MVLLTRSIKYLLLACAITLSVSCSLNTKKTQINYAFDNDGRDNTANILPAIYTQDAMPQIEQIAECNLHDALRRQKKYLAKKINSPEKYIDGVSVDPHSQMKVLEIVENNINNLEQALSALRAYKIWGKDKRGNVQFTAYFSPKMLVSSVKTERFAYPVYSKPDDALKVDGQFPTRDEIDYQAALMGLGLELAYAENLIDPFFMQIQGSGIVEFVDTGEISTFAYAGKNGHAYHSIGRYLVEENYLTPAEVSLASIKQWLLLNPQRQRQVLSLNPSYVFFKKTQQLPMGSIGQPVTAYCSVAVDPSVIPYGSTLIIKRPILDQLGNLVDHQNSLFFAQDRGGAIKGAGRVDIYMGVGEQAKQAASALKHYGNLWLLLPK